MLVLPAVSPLVVHNDAVGIQQVGAMLSAGEVAHIILSPGPGSPDVPQDIGACVAVGTAGLSVGGGLAQRQLGLGPSRLAGQRAAGSAHTAAVGHLDMYQL